MGQNTNVVQVRMEVREMVKRFPLAISRGVSAKHRNVFVRLEEAGHVGFGEASPGGSYDSEDLIRQIPLAEDLVRAIDWGTVSPFELDAELRSSELVPPMRAALEIAFWDLSAKRIGVPLYRMLGLPRQSVPTSVTIGLNPPEETTERVPKILETVPGVKYLKIKLGSPAGEDFDRAHFLAARDAAASFGVGLRVDANGGWSLQTALRMVDWLAGYEVDYVEQPLVEGAEADLSELYRQSPLPIFADESLKTSADVPKLAQCVHGINLKIMKTGGIGEAMRAVATARAHGLKTMIGCMGESSVAIAAGAAIGGLFDFIDLDSHLNLDPDPATGLQLEAGSVLPSDQPGLGVRLEG